MKHITEWTVKELAAALQAGALSAEEAARAYLERIGTADGEIGAYLTVTAEQALAEARAVDKQRLSGEELPPLAGIPCALKDNICTKGVRTTCASRMLADYRPPYDATVAARLKEARAVLLGKCNMDEFAMGSSTENSYFQTTRNPRALDRVPGGSSGGSAAAVAAGEAAFALGSDTGGSIRQPSAFCGVVGMKPTYGAVSRYGLVAFASSLDQIGPITRTVWDNALVLNAVAGCDKRDATCAPGPRGDYLAGIEGGVKGLRLGLAEEFMDEGIDEPIRAAILRAASALEKRGAEIVPLSLPALKEALSAYYILSSAEASSNLSRFDGLRYGFRAEGCQSADELFEKTRAEGFGPEVKRRVMLGAFALSAGYRDAYYQKACHVREKVKSEYARAFTRCEALLSPVAPTVAYRFGEKIADPRAMYLGDICTVPANIAGLPALSLPCGADAAGLPIGMQWTGPAFSEGLLYRIGHAYEKEAVA